ncbi:MAG: hypothetical protein JSV51_08060 [Candidatus Bathyarchaeota archaeon]|nr:MAG: hypothetical protein JSV51_08060 [Candidatus Bathyarchaeota archaeon]
MHSISPIALIAFGIIGCSFIGFVAGLSGVVTNEYLDYSQSGNPLAREYDFRLGGKYGSITLSMLVAGSILGFAGNTVGFHMLYKGQQDKNQKKPKIPKIVPTLMCPRCKRMILDCSKFCLKCGTDIAE